MSRFRDRLDYYFYFLVFYQEATLMKKDFIQSLNLSPLLISGFQITKRSTAKIASTIHNPSIPNASDIGFSPGIKERYFSTK